MNEPFKIPKIVAVCLSLGLLFQACSSSTMIQSKPSGAKVYVDGQSVGKTPYRYSDSKIIGSCTYLKLTQDGYDELNTSFCRDEEPDVGAIVGGFFIMPIWLWALKYKPVHEYELEIPSAGSVTSTPTNLSESGVSNTPNKQSVREPKSKADKLRELKELLDEGILTEEEYAAEKAKILSSD